VKRQWDVDRIRVSREGASLASRELIGTKVQASKVRQQSRNIVWYKKLYIASYKSPPNQELADNIRMVATNLVVC